MLNQDNYEMSFSGLKSALANTVAELRQSKTKEEMEKLIPYLAKEVNEAVVEVLTTKTIKAIEEYMPKSVLLAGGVAANTLLRTELKKKMGKNSSVKLFMPEMKYCTDNAAMIGVAAILKPRGVDVLKLRPEPGLQTV